MTRSYLCFLAFFASLALSTAARADDVTLTFYNNGVNVGYVTFDPTLASYSDAIRSTYDSYVANAVGGELDSFDVFTPQAIASTVVSFPAISLYSGDIQEDLFGPALVENYPNSTVFVDGNYAVTSANVYVDGELAASDVFPDFTVQVTTAAATPEPASFILLGTGILGVAGAARRRFLRA